MLSVAVGHRRRRVEDALAPREGGRQRAVVGHIGFEQERQQKRTDALRTYVPGSRTVACTA
jgi:hypothetical protein